MASAGDDINTRLRLLERRCLCQQWALVLVGFLAIVVPLIVTRYGAAFGTTSSSKLAEVEELRVRQISFVSDRGPYLLLREGGSPQWKDGVTDEYYKGIDVVKHPDDPRHGVRGDATPGNPRSVTTIKPTGVRISTIDHQGVPTSSGLFGYAVPGRDGVNESLGLFLRDGIYTSRERSYWITPSGGR